MVLTPSSRSIAALVLAVTVIFGSWSRGGYSLNMLLLQNDARTAAIIGSLVPLAVSALAYALAQSVLTGSPATAAATPGWEHHVAGAARLLAAAGIVLTVLVLLGALVHGESVYNPVF
jgi:hypothetical protein